MTARTAAAMAVLTLLFSPSLVHADIPEPPCADVATAGGTLYIAPGGGGERLSDIAATISVTIYDANAMPIANYPRQDIWALSAIPGEVVICNGGAGADSDTNALGQTTISGTLAGGGHTQNGVRVFLAGVAVTCHPALPIRINSPDITGDLKVDLADIGPFSQSLLTQTNVFRADFFDDDKVDLADIGIFAQFIGDACF